MNSSGNKDEDVLSDKGKGLAYLIYISIFFLFLIIISFILYATGISREPKLLSYLIYFLVTISICVAIAQIYILNKLKRSHRGDNYSHSIYLNQLTGLPGRYILNDRLDQYLLQAKNYKRFAAVMILDIDRLKKVNDTYGYSMGNKLLKEVAKRLTTCIKEVDTLCHTGEDHFVLVFPDIPQIYEAAFYARRILEEVSKPYRIDDINIIITASLGISIYPLDGSSSEILMKNAEGALARAKEQGRNNYQMYTSAMTSIINERVNMEKSLKRAILKKEFILHYQPIVTAEGEKIIGVEALLRWQHPSLGLIIPGKFMSIAEETGLILDIGKWVLMTVCAQNKSWQDSGLQKVPVTVNISPLQFYQEDLIDTIKAVLKETGLEACYLELDIGETAFKNLDLSLKILEKLKKLGVRLAIDDFGTGSIPLKSLKKLPVDTLKIDKVFINDITHKSDEEIAASIISIGHSLDCNVTAVGVETREHLLVLRNHSCDRIQGYYFSEPVPVERITLLMKEQQGSVE